jgi:hypothetical protein
MLNEVIELMDLFVTQYQTKTFGFDGEQSDPAPLDKLDTKIAAGSTDGVTTRIRQLAAREGIEDFVAFCRQFLVEHPPETHIMLAQGFGVRLASGYDVCLTPPQYEHLPGTLEPAMAVPVTMGMGSPGMKGIEQSQSYAVTGALAHPGLRGPGAN